VDARWQPRGNAIGLAVLLFAPEDALRLGVGASTLVMALPGVGARLGDSSIGRNWRRLLSASSTPARA